MRIDVCTANMCMMYVDNVKQHVPSRHVYGAHVCRHSGLVYRHCADICACMDNAVRRRAMQHASWNLQLTSMYAVLCRRLVDESDVDNVKKHMLGATHDKDPNAMYKLALLYKQGCRNLPRNHKRALEWLEQSMERGCKEAVNEIGIFHRDGIAVEPDFEQATPFFRRCPDYCRDGATRNNC